MKFDSPHKKHPAFSMILVLLGGIFTLSCGFGGISPEQPTPVPPTETQTPPPAPIPDPTAAPLTLSLGAFSLRLLGQQTPQYEMILDVTNDGSQIAKDFDIEATIQTQDTQNPTIVNSVVQKGYLNPGQHFTYYEPFINPTQFPLPSPQNVEIRVYLGDQVFNDEIKYVEISS